MLVLCFGLDFKYHPRDLTGGEGVLLHHGGVLTNKGSQLPLSNVLFSWDVSGNYSTKSTMAECVKPIYLGCVFELSLRAFETSQICWGVGVGRSKIPIQVRLSCLRLNN